MEFCDGMKDVGIIIYLVYFGNNNNFVLVWVMKDCVSKISIYINVLFLVELI